jgi:hypothetical protein
MSESFESRVAEARRASAGSATLASLFSLLDDEAVVVLDSAVGSACLRHDGRRFEVAIGADFYERELGAPLDLGYLVAHELMHLVRGEHELPPDPREAAARNIAADVVNDAFLLGPVAQGPFDPVTGIAARRLVPGPVGVLLAPSAALAAALGRPEGLLATGIEYFQSRVSAPNPPGAAPWDPTAWAEVHWMLTSGGARGTLDHETATALVRPLLRQLPDDALPAAPDGLDGRTSGLAAALRARLSVAYGGRKAGSGAPRRAVTLTPQVPRAARRIAALLHAWARPGSATARGWSPAGSALRPADVGSRVSARSAVDFACGLRATPFAAEAAVGGEAPQGVTLYLDVSGSMHRALPEVLAVLLREARPLLSRPVYAFSDTVTALDDDALRLGRIETGFGTSFDAVAAHLVEQRIGRAVVITDGEGRLSAESQRLLERLRPELALVFPEELATSPLDRWVPQHRRLAIGLGSKRPF